MSFRFKAAGIFLLLLITFAYGLGHSDSRPDETTERAIFAVY